MADEDRQPERVTGEVVSTPDVAGEWLTPPQAAAKLGMSERTLWRRVDEGRYQKRLVNRRAEILVPLPVTGATGSGTDPDCQVTDTLAVREPDAAILAVVAELKERRQQDADVIDRLTGRLTDQAAEIGRLRVELAQAEARLKARRWWNPATW